MKQLSAACLLLSLVTSSAILTTTPVDYQTGQYLYTYKAITQTGVPLTSNERAGLYISSDVYLTFTTDQSAVLTLDEVLLRQINMTTVEDVLPIDRVLEPTEMFNSGMFSRLTSLEVEQTILRFLTLPVHFTWEKTTGLIKDIKTTDDEPAYITNIKLGILQQLQMQFKTTPIMRTEDTILGENCEVFYDSMELIDTTTNNITVTTNVNKCQRPIMFRDLIGLSGERLDTEEDLIRGTMTTRATVVPTTTVRPFIKRAVTEGRYVVRMFNTNGGEVSTFTRQELIFKKKVVTPVDVMETMHVNKITSTLAMHMTTDTQVVTSIYDEIMTEDEKVSMIYELLERVMTGIKSKDLETFTSYETEMYMYIVRLMRTLTKTDSFVTLITRVINEPTLDDSRPMFINALAFCGSPILVETLPLIQEHMTTTEINTILTSLPATLMPTETTLRTLMTMYKDGEVEATCKQLLLVIGAETHQLCKTTTPGQMHPLDICSETLKKDLIKFFTDAFTTSPDARKVIVLKAIGNSGLPMTTKLTQIIHSTETTTELRVNAIYAMRRIEDTQTVIETLLPVFNNEHGLYNVELRIAAFNILVDCEPTEEMLTMLTTKLNFEHDRQLGNYIYSFVDNLITMPQLFTPTRDLTVAAQNILPTIRRFEDGVWYSKNIEQVIMTVSRRFAALIETNTIFTQEQALPRSMNLRLVRTICGYYTSLMEVGFRLEGLDTLVRDYLLNMDTTLEMADTMMSGKFRQEMNMIRTMLREDITPRAIEETKGYMFMKYLGNELNVITIDDLPTINTENTLMTIIEMFHSEINYLTIVPMTYGVIRVQTPLGIPMIATYNVISMFSFEMRTPETGISETTLLSRDLVPRLMVAANFNFGSDLALIQTTFKQRLAFRTVTDFNLKVTLDDNNQWGVYLNLNTPDNTESYIPFYVLSTQYIHTTTMNNNELLEETDLIATHPLMSDRDMIVKELIDNVILTRTRAHLEWTMKEPLAPFCGNHWFGIELLKPVRLGLGIEIRPTTLPNNKYQLLLNLILNPLLNAPLKKELTVTTTLDYETAPLMTLEVLPKYLENPETFKLFLDFQRLTGNLFTPIFNWINAGEDKIDLLEIKETLQFGWGITFDETDQDIVMTSIFKKSDLQKTFELVDTELTNSECSKCEKNLEDDLFTTVDCMRCMFKRQWISRIESDLIINPRIIDLLRPLTPIRDIITRMATPYFMPMMPIDTMRRTPPSWLRTTPMTMTIITDIHPYMTEFNVTTTTNDDVMTWTHLPLVPAFRRLDNLPTHMLTDVALDRLHPLPMSLCTLDTTGIVETFDGLRYPVPTEKNCERILMKDFTTEDKFEIRTTITKDTLRGVSVTLPNTLIEVIPKIKGTYDVKINTVLQTWTTNEDNMMEVLVEGLHVIRHVIDMPNGVKATQTTIRLPTLKTTIILVNDLIQIRAPFIFRDQVLGLCGDFNGEKIHELVLPDQTLATDLDTFVTTYSSDKCRA